MAAASATCSWNFRSRRSQLALETVVAAFLRREQGRHSHVGHIAAGRSPTARVRAYSGENVLDLVFSDVAGTVARVVPGISDHEAVVTRAKFSVPATEEHSRLAWEFHKADWMRLQDKFTEHSWECMASMDPDAGAEFFTNSVLDLTQECIPRVNKDFKKSTHPWLTDLAVEAVKEKLAAQGTEAEREKAERCSSVLMGEESSTNTWFAARGG